MSSTLFKDLYDEAEPGSVGGNIPKGSYEMIVTGTRVLDTSSLIFLTLQVLNGPQQGKEIDVNLYFPNETAKRGAHVFFTKKIQGFIAFPDVKAAFQAAGNAPDLKSGFEHIAASFVGKEITAEIDLVTEGDYAGNNQLSSTRPLAGGAVQPAPAAAPVAAPAEAPAPAPVAEGAVAEAPPF